MRGARRAEVVLLALLYAVSGVLCLFGAAWPLTSESPVALGWALGCTGVVGAAVIWAVGDRCATAVTHVGFAVISALVAVLAARSVTAVGIVGLGPALIALALYAAHFFALTTARLQVAALVALASTGAALAGPSGFTLPWVVVVVTTVVLFEAQARLSRRLREAATTDPLTGVANRRAWQQETTRVLSRAARTGEAVTIALLDLDGFKDVNDTHGHAAGDALLRDLTTRWTQQLRRSDLLGRYGGDEFVLTLPGTDQHGAQEILDRLAASHPAPWSVGTATTQGAEPLSAVLARADAALYRNKKLQVTPPAAHPET